MIQVYVRGVLSFIIIGLNMKFRVYIVQSMVHDFIYNI